MNMVSDLQLPHRAKTEPTSYQGTVIAEIAKSRADIESGRLLVLSAALQVDI